MLNSVFSRTWTTTAQTTQFTYSYSSLIRASKFRFASMLFNPVIVIYLRFIYKKSQYRSW